ncbi:MAG: sigma-54 dependent transcriptional regulator [Elusimicrobiota bacterium]
MNRLRILVVDDDKLAQRVLAEHLGSHDVHFAGDLVSAKSALGAGQFHICFIDIQLGKDDDCSGLKVIPLAAAKGIYSVVMSSHDSEGMVDNAYELGCDDYYVKGNEESNVRSILGKYLQKRTGLNAEQIFSRQFITQDPATRAGILEGIKYAPSDLPILILGPSGTGKTSLGRLIHDHSQRKGEFVAINCSAYSEELLEAELFGYKKGAFTGAGESRKGRLAQADKGTLFLDEIGAMSLNMQTKLLKAIEERTYYPVGSDKAESSEFRIISATLEDLQRLISQGRLRFDFFQRIHGLTITLKPLAQRTCDIFPLVQFFTQGLKRLSFSADAKACMLNHSWPGNTRELKRLMTLLASGHEGRVAKEQVLRHLSQSPAEAAAPAGAFVGEHQYRYALEKGLNGAVDRFIAEVVQRNLAENGGKKTRTLSALKISTRLLYSALKTRIELPKTEPKHGNPS